MMEISRVIREPISVISGNIGNFGYFVPILFFAKRDTFLIFTIAKVKSGRLIFKKIIPENFGVFPESIIF